VDTVCTVPVGTLVSLVTGARNYARPIDLNDLPTAAPDPVTLENANE
jgi:hypothetical protein